MLFCCSRRPSLQRSPSSAQTAAKTNAYFKEALPLILSVFLQLAIDSSTSAVADLIEDGETN